MNQENRDKVLHYINIFDSTPLVFYNYESPKDEFNPEKYTVEQMVMRVLELTKTYPSYDGLYKQCRSGCMRSSLDIWRHIIYYYPNIEIFDVMHELCKLNKTGKLYGHFCTAVNRRVFRLEGNILYMDKYNTPEIMLTYASRRDDEYELEWETWESI